MPRGEFSLSIGGMNIINKIFYLMVDIDIVILVGPKILESDKIFDTPLEATMHYFI